MRAELSKAVDAAALAGGANIASPKLNLVALAQDFGDANFAPGYLGSAASGAGAASYAVTYNTSQLTVTGSASTQGLIARLFGVNTIPMTATGVARKNHVQIMLVLDLSGSMGPSLANMKTAANSFLSFFTPDQSEDAMGLVTFSTAATVKVPLETNFATSIQASINSATANGRTNTEDAIAQAGAQLPIQTGTPNADWKQQYLVFMTDGDPTAFRSTFVHANTSYDAVVSAAPNASGSNQWYDVDPYLSSPTTGNALSVNAVQTGQGKNETTCRTGTGTGTSPYVYSTSWATPFAAFAPTSPYSTVGYCDIPQGNPGPRTVLAGYIANTAEQMAINKAASLKARGITIYTIGLKGDGGDPNTAFLNSLSSGSSYAYVAPTSAQLQAIFNTIAKDIILRLVQ
jgi:hypothetical protein